MAICTLYFSWGSGSVNSGHAVKNAYENFTFPPAKKWVKILSLDKKSKGYRNDMKGEDVLTAKELVQSASLEPLCS